MDWLTSLIDGLGNAISGAFENLWNSVSGSIWDVFLKWIFEAIYGAIADFFRSGETELELLIPYSDGQIAAYVRRNGTVISEEYEDTGTRVKCRLADEFLYKVRDYIDEK